MTIFSGGKTSPRPAAARCASTWHRRPDVAAATPTLVRQKTAGGAAGQRSVGGTAAPRKRSWIESMSPQLKRKSLPEMHQLGSSLESWLPPADDLGLAVYRAIACGADCLEAIRENMPEVGGAGVSSA